MDIFNEFSIQFHFRLEIFSLLIQKMGFSGFSGNPTQVVVVWDMCSSVTTWCSFLRVHYCDACLQLYFPSLWMDGKGTSHVSCEMTMAKFCTYTYYT